jgi:D-mannonate dehydratase
VRWLNTEKERLMKLAVELGNIGDSSPEATIRYCQDLGIEGISVPWAQVPGYEDKGYVEADRLKALRAQIEDGGIALASMVAWVPPAVTAGDAKAEALFGNLRRSMESMAAAGADTLVAFSPITQETPWEQAAGFYRRFVDVAERCKVRIATHTHGILKTQEVLTRLMQAAPSAYNGLCFCTGNIWHGEGEKTYDVLRQLKDKIFFVHIRNVKTGMGEKEYWLDQGDVDIPRVVQVLKEIGYSGYLRSEHLPTDHYGRHIPTVSGVSDVSAAWAMGYLRAFM